MLIGRTRTRYGKTKRYRTGTGTRRGIQSDRDCPGNFSCDTKEREWKEKERVLLFWLGLNEWRTLETNSIENMLCNMETRDQAPSSFSKPAETHSTAITTQKVPPIVISEQKSWMVKREWIQQRQIQIKYCHLTRRHTDPFFKNRCSLVNYPDIKRRKPWVPLSSFPKRRCWA